MSRIKEQTDNSFFATDSAWQIMLKTAPPVMLAQLIQALYNMVDSYFIGRFSEDGLTALSVIFPIQWLIIAFAVGTGVGVNTLAARYYALNEKEKADETAATGMVLAALTWGVFSVLAVLFLQFYVKASAKADSAVSYAMSYGLIVCVGSLGIFLESIWTKVHQAQGNMKRPMVAQIAGAITNIILDPVLIFGMGPIPEMGIVGAALATVAGQAVAAIITAKGAIHRPVRFRKMFSYIRRIYSLGYPSIFMQMLCTVYIVVLNIILAGFSDAAVTVLGLYYKVQSFFFIPIGGLQTCIVPVLSYNYSRGSYERCKEVLKASVLMAMGLMLIGVLSFELIPDKLIRIFSDSKEVLEIGKTAFRIIGSSFLPAVLSLILPVFFQAIGRAVPSVVLALMRQIVCLIPVFYGLSFIGLNNTWFAFPIAETITGAVGVCLYLKQLKKWKP